MTLDDVFEKTNRQPVTAKLQLKNKSTTTCGMKLEIPNEKNTKPAATKKAETSNHCPTPQQQQKQKAKTKKK